MTTAGVTGPAQPPAEFTANFPSNARSAGAEEGRSAAIAGDTLDIEARMRLKRQMIREELLGKLQESLSRMDEPHLEFFPVRDDVKERVYPKAPAASFRAYAQAFATLFKEYRLEVGEATDRPETTSRILDEVKDDHERAAIKRMIDMGIALKRQEDAKEAQK